MKFEGILHQYDGRHVAFQFDKVENPKKALIFIGGLTDGLLTVPYVPALSKRVAKECGYSTFQIQFKSSFAGWGTSSLDQDIKDMESLVKYLQNQIGVSKIVIMGHSTGSQDVIHYLLNAGTNVQAGIMQASISDRESFNVSKSEKGQKLNQIAEDLVAQGKGNTLLSDEHCKFAWNTPITAYRWTSLMGKFGDDDYFSSDLTQKELKFGQISVPFLICYSEKDEFVPADVDKIALLQKWREASDERYWSKHSGLIKNANHNVKDLESQEDLFKKVVGFINEFNL
ncbi:hypothetical protein ACO0QE_002398 [Hanseniaspora vineae]